MKKIIIIVSFVLAVVLLLGITVSIFNAFDKETVFNITVKYQTVGADGHKSVFKTYTCDYENGSEAVIISPYKENYIPEKEKLAFVVTNDMYITVDYICNHKYGNKTAISYPAADSVGKYSQECQHCGHSKITEFTTLSETIVFGGDELLELTSIGDRVGKYYLTSDKYTTGVCLLKNKTPELDFFFEGLPLDGANGNFGQGLTVNVEYDPNYWTEELRYYQGYQPNMEHSYIRVGTDWRIIFQYIGDEDILTWLGSDDCPLVRAPITVTLTYDFTKDF